MYYHRTKARKSIRENKAFDLNLKSLHKGRVRTKERKPTQSNQPPFVINFNFLWKIPKEIINLDDS